MSAGVALSGFDLLIAHTSRGGAFELTVPRIELCAGEVLAVLGPNGAGKSSLLRALAGLEVPERGRIDCHVDGAVTMVFQRPVALAGSVRHNLRAALLGTRLSRAEVVQRSGEALERFGISHLAQRRAATLSGGELRRLALARAFALQPGVLLLDEPFDDLDAMGQESLSLDLRRAIAETNVAVAVVTHDLRRALLLSDRIAVLMGGQLAQCDTRDHVLARPATPDVARLVGMSNLIPGVIERGADGTASVRVAGARIELPLAPDLGPEVWIGVRPENLKIDTGRGESRSIGKGRVVTVVSDGVTLTAGVEWECHMLRTVLLAGRSLARSLSPGDTVTLSLRPEDVHLMARSAEPRS